MLIAPEPYDASIVCQLVALLAYLAEPVAKINVRKAIFFRRLSQRLERESAMNTTSAPAFWEIEQEVCNIVAEHLGLRRAEVRPSSRLLEDLNFDSLDLFDFTLELEDRYNVRFDNQQFQQFFAARRPATISHIAEFVLLNLQSGAAPPKRDRRTELRSLPDRDEAPFMQFDCASRKQDWLDGVLYEAISTNAEGYRQFVRRTDGMRCILIPEGDAVLGSDSSAALADARPQHSARLRDYLIDAEPISNLAFARFLNAVSPVHDSQLRDWFVLDEADRRRDFMPLTKSWLGRWAPRNGCERQPTVLVSWFGANAYSLWANRRDWRAYREFGVVAPGLESTHVDAPPALGSLMGSFLPSEAQWEHAARGPSLSPASPTDKEIEASTAAGQYASGIALDPGALPMPPVNQRVGVSPFGLHHATGTVWQWCRDWYSRDFYATAEARGVDPQNERPSGLRSERGGSWVGPARLAHPAYRRARVPIARGRCLGFRCVGLVDDLR